MMNVVTDNIVIISAIAVVIFTSIIFFLFKSKGAAEKDVSDSKKTESKNQSKQAQQGQSKNLKKLMAQKPNVSASSPSTLHQHPLLISKLKGHKEKVTSVSFPTKIESNSPVYLATCSSDRTVRLYSLDSLSSNDHKNIQLNLPYDHAVSSSFASDGVSLYLAFVEKNRPARLSIRSTRNSEGKYFDMGSDFECAHNHEIKHLACAPSGDYLVSTTSETEAIVWSTAGKVLKKIDTKQMQNFQVSVSPDSRFFAIGCWTSDVKIYEASYDKKMAQFQGIKANHVMALKGHSSGIRSLHFGGDSKTIVTASSDATFKMWNIDVKYDMQDDPKCLYTVQNPIPSSDGKKNPFNQIAIAPNASTIAVTVGHHLLFYKAKDGTHIETIMNAHSGSINSICWSPDSKILATGSSDTFVGTWKNPIQEE